MSQYTCGLPTLARREGGVVRLLVWLLEQGPFVDWVRDERLPLIIIIILIPDSASSYHLPNICYTV